MGSEKKILQRFFQSFAYLKYLDDTICQETKEIFESIPKIDIDSFPERIQSTIPKGIQEENFEAIC